MVVFCPARFLDWYLDSTPLSESVTIKTIKDHEWVSVSMIIDENTYMWGSIRRGFFSYLSKKRNFLWKMNWGEKKKINYFFYADGHIYLNAILILCLHRGNSIWIFMD